MVGKKVKVIVSADQLSPSGGLAVVSFDEGYLEMRPKVIRHVKATNKFNQNRFHTEHSPRH